MTTSRSLWPEDLTTEDVRTPKEILGEQAHSLESMTNGVLAGTLVEDVIDGRRVIGFDVVASRVPTTVRLFDVYQSPKLDYPVRIIPPNVEIPEYLRRKVYHPGPLDFSVPTATLRGSWEEREWVAASPAEFTEKLQQLFSSTGIKSIMFSLLARSKVPNGNPESSGE